MGYSAAEPQRPAYTGFCSTYLRCSMKLARSLTPTSEEVFCHTSPTKPSSFDQLNSFLNAEFAGNTQQDVHMIRHDHEIVNC
jgi:hypothetical protein